MIPALDICEHAEEQELIRFLGWVRFCYPLSVFLLKEAIHNYVRLPLLRIRSAHRPANT